MTIQSTNNSVSVLIKSHNVDFSSSFSKEPKMLSGGKRILKLLHLINGTTVIRTTLLGLLLLVILYEVTVYNIGLITGDYYKILNNKDQNAFLRQTLKSLGLILGLISKCLFSNKPHMFFPPHSDFSTQVTERLLCLTVVRQVAQQTNWRSSATLSDQSCLLSVKCSTNGQTVSQNT